MDEHNFKIGDRVRLKGGTYCGISGDDIGVVADIGGYIEVSWEGNLGKRLGYYPHLPSEIEPVMRVGAQLMLFELN